MDNSRSDEREFPHSRPFERTRIYQAIYGTSDCVLSRAIACFIVDWVVDLLEKNDSWLRVSSILIFLEE